MSQQPTYDQPSDRDHGPTVLIVDDQEVWQQQLKRLCHSSKSGKASRVLVVSTLRKAAEILSTTSVQVLLLDKNLDWNQPTGHQNGIENIPNFLELQPHLQILVVTGSDDIQDCVKAMRFGAFGYITKGNPEEAITQQINKALEVSMLVMQKIRVDRGEQRTQGTSKFAGHSSAIRIFKTKLEAVSETNKPVLLLGESGTGKTTAARFIHERRKQFLKQKDRPFFAFNITSLSPELVERELFGNEKGAYTDAKDAKPGFFELANNGTLFLDEIGDANFDLQTKLLKTIEEGKFFRVGGQQERYSNFKLICATNKNLEKMVADGSFREDLYMRISTFIVDAPSLRDRPEDIPDIIRSLLPKCCEDNNVQINYEDLPADFIEYLVDSSGKGDVIKGNVRGIEHQLSRLLVYASKDKNGQPILNQWKIIPGLYLKRSSVVNLRESLSLKEIMNRPFNVAGTDFPGLKVFQDHIMKQVIQDTIKKYPSLREASKILGIPKSTLSDHLKRMDLEKSVLVFDKTNHLRSDTKNATARSIP
jgi:DNA-binding NtrC family response regulator